MKPPHSSHKSTQTLNLCQSRDNSSKVPDPNRPGGLYFCRSSEMHVIKVVGYTVGASVNLCSAHAYIVVGYCVVGRAPHPSCNFQLLRNDTVPLQTPSRPCTKRPTIEWLVICVKHPQNIPTLKLVCISPNFQS